MARSTRPRKPDGTTRSAHPGVHERLAAFVAERFPLGLDRIVDALGTDLSGLAPSGPTRAEQLERLRPQLRERLTSLLAVARHLPEAESTPGVHTADRMKSAGAEVADAVDGFLRREALTAGLTREERLELLRGMLLTRATDNQLKALFLGGQVRYGNQAFQGKGFRSLGQEAIYAAPLRLRRGARWWDPQRGWRGDVVAPLIRDLGAALAMCDDDEAIEAVLRAQMGKAGPPMNGKDFHIGNLDRGVLPAAAPLAISTANVAGLALAFARQGEGRVAVSFIGEGGSSLGEWHEAINLCAARRLPAVFCIENNRTALSTPLSDQTAVRVFADKAAGYGVPGITLDGTDPEAIAAAFAWAAERAREGLGPSLIELLSLRMCGHAHHDDMLYLGREPQLGWDYPTPTDSGYVDRAAWAFWASRDPIARYAERLEAEGLVTAETLAAWRNEAERRLADAAQRVVATAWPEGVEAGIGVFADEPPREHVEVLERRGWPGRPEQRALPELEVGPPFDPKGRTFLDAVTLGIGDALRADSRVFVFGEDVAAPYGNAFLLLRPLLAEFGSRILNSPLCEGGLLGAAIGAALAGERPIAEIQFNDFVATGFNQLVNNAAKIRYRWGGSVPLVVRMPWGGLRRAGPYHSQNTEPWFYRTPGLKIVAPSTPFDARALLAAAVTDPDPVLFYEHIGLYRDPKIKQVLAEEPAAPLALGRAALRRSGDDLAIVSYGAYVHVAMRVADRLAPDGIDAAVLDLRSLVPLDREALLAVARHCGRVLIVHEDSRTGGLGESLAAIIQEEAFEFLDAPVRVMGALDAPVPYSPPLEDAYLPGDSRVERAARLLAAF